MVVIGVSAGDARAAALAALREAWAGIAMSLKNEPVPEIDKVKFARRPLPLVSARRF